MSIRPTNVASLTDAHERRRSEPVPPDLARHHGPEDLEIAARQLAREGFGSYAIADALKLDVLAVRKMIGEQQP